MRERGTTMRSQICHRMHPPVQMQYSHLHLENHTPAASNHDREAAAYWQRRMKDRDTKSTPQHPRLSESPPCSFLSEKAPSPHQHAAAAMNLENATSAKLRPWWPVAREHSRRSSAREMKWR